MWHIATNAVAWSVGLSVTTVSCAKMAEQVVTPFGMRTRVDPGNHVLDGGPDPHVWMRNFEGEKGPGHVQQ